jgi:hypothetical protein
MSVHADTEDKLVEQPAIGLFAELISPVLANIYLHYVLDLWMDKEVRRRIGAAAVYMRYADY